MFKLWVSVTFLTVFCIGIALIPETAMYFFWQIINPSEALEKILTLALFWVFGASLCIFSAIISVALWLFIFSWLLS